MCLIALTCPNSMYVQWIICCVSLIKLFSGINGSTCREGARKKWVLQLFLEFNMKNLSAVDFFLRMNNYLMKCMCACVCFHVNTQRHGYCTLGEAINRLDFSSAIQDLRRFNYVAKVSSDNLACWLIIILKQKLCDSSSNCTTPSISHSFSS